MYQREIEFFWPLTEQIPLDLDYSNCVRPELTISNTDAVASLISTFPIGFPIGTVWTTIARERD